MGIDRQWTKRGGWKSAARFRRRGYFAWVEDDGDDGASWFVVKDGKVVASGEIRASMVACGSDYLDKAIAAAEEKLREIGAIS